MEYHEYQDALNVVEEAIKDAAAGLMRPEYAIMKIRHAVSDRKKQDPKAVSYISRVEISSVPRECKVFMDDGSMLGGLSFVDVDPVRPEDAVQVTIKAFLHKGDDHEVGEQNKSADPASDRPQDPGRIERNADHAGGSDAP